MILLTLLAKNEEVIRQPVTVHLLIFCFICFICSV